MTDLPKKFTERERCAYQWLHDCNIRGWVVDYVTKSVHTDTGRAFPSLVSFARNRGMNREPNATSTAAEPQRKGVMWKWKTPSTRRNVRICNPGVRPGHAGGRQ